jgi:hypothetical protein
MDNSYDKKTIYTFSIIGAHLVEIFYIHLYNEGEKLKLSKTAKTQTEGYKFAVHSFISSMNKNSKKYKPKFYNELLIGLTEYFATYTEKPSLKLKGCVDMVVAEFVPSNYFQSASNEQRRFLFDKILGNGIKKLTEFIFGEFLPRVIDDHDNQDNVETLKEKMIEIFSNERQNLYSELLVGVSSRQSSESMAINNYKTEIKKLKSELQDANHMISELTIVCTERANGLKKAMEACRGLVMKCNGKDDEIKLLNEKLARKQKEIFEKEENMFTNVPKPLQTPRYYSQPQPQTREQSDEDEDAVVVSKVDDNQSRNQEIKKPIKPLENSKQDNKPVVNSKQDNKPVVNSKKDNLVVNSKQDNKLVVNSKKDNLVVNSKQDNKPEVQVIDDESDVELDINEITEEHNSDGEKDLNKDMKNENDLNKDMKNEEESDDESKKRFPSNQQKPNTQLKELNYNDLSDIENEDNIEAPSVSKFMSNDSAEPPPKESKKGRKPKPKQEKPRTSSQMLERARYNIGNAPNLLEDY